MTSMIAIHMMRRQWRREFFFQGWTWRLILVSVVFLLGLLVTQTGSGHRLGDESETISSSTRPLPPILPREWRWTRKPVDFDSMYRSSDSGRKLDWIRDGRSSY